MTQRLTATVDDAGELASRAQAVLREAAWFVKCEGATDAGRLWGALVAWLRRVPVVYTVAPFGEESPNTQRVHTVHAYPDWHAAQG